jgi:hypothetical protein
MKFIIMKFSPRALSLPFRSKYPPRHSRLKKTSVYVPPLKWETKVRTHTAQLAKLVLYILIFRFFIWYGKRKDSGLNGSKHDLNLIIAS